MLKRTFRGMILGVAGLLVLTLTPAHAAVTVSIDAEEGDIVFSLPGLPEGVEYPSEIQTVITGTAGFDSTDGGVLYQFIVDGPEGEIVYYSGQADLAPAGCSAECTWSFRVPFLLPPSEYDVKAIASQPDPVNPELPPETATDTVHVMVL